jgi:hypothetical protein
MADKYYAVGQGKVYLATRDISGQTGGFEWIGDTDGFTVNGTEENLEFQESYSGKRATVLNITTSTNLAFSLGIRNINGDNLARAYYGTNASGVGATVTAEAIVGYNGKMTPLKYPGVSSVVVKKGATTLVLGTDYSLDAVNGSITILAGSTEVPAGPGVALTVDYTYAAYSSKVKGLVRDSQEYILRFEGKSQYDNKAQIATFFRAKPGIAAALELIGTDVAVLTLEGQLLPAPEITTSGESQYFTYVQV